MRNLTWRQKGLIGTFLSASLVALAAGCSGGGGSDSPTPTPTPACSPIAPNLSILQSAIFAPSCGISSSCHLGPAAAGLGFDTTTAATVLATGSNVLASETFNSNGVTRIVPGSHATSYVWLKVTGATGISGVRMPQTGQYLDSCQIDAIAAWIDQGAQNN